MNHKIVFDDLPWIESAAGMRYKVYINGSRRIRLAEFSYGFREDDWCASAHAGYILEGELTIDYNGMTEHYRAGDVIDIPSGEAHHHKVTPNTGERALILLFEVI